MKRPALFLRGAAVVSSLLLLVVFVYDRAGGNVFQKLGLSRHSSDERLLPGSKSEANIIFASDTELLPGSKSTMVVEPANDQPVEITESRQLLPGSKSLVIEPAENDNTPASEPVEIQTTGTPNAAQPSPPQPNPPPRQLLPGSKAPASLFGSPESETDSPTQSSGQQQAQPQTSNRGR